MINQPTDSRVLAVPVGCGNCIECRKQKKREWQTRLLEEVKTEKNGQMVTLTFSTEALKELENEISQTLKGYEKDNAIAALATRRFLERHRKKYKKSIRHWLITELGGGRYEHLHIHGIIWTDITAKEIAKLWQYGYIWAGYKNKRTYVNEQTINYIIKYVTKLDPKHKTYKPRILTSAGIGKKYTETSNFENSKYNNHNTREYYKTRTGHKIALPIYYRNKLYNDDEKEKLWIEKLNKNIRYVNGQEISIEKGFEEYNEALKQAQEKNIQLGYGTGNDWKNEQYEKERRILLQDKRIEEYKRKELAKP